MQCHWLRKTFRLLFRGAAMSMGVVKLLVDILKIFWRSYIYNTWRTKYCCLPPSTKIAANLVFVGNLNDDVFFVFVGWFRFRVDVLLLPTRWNAKLRRLVNLMQKIKMRWHRSTLQAESFDTKKTWAKISCNKKTHVMSRKKNKTLLGVHSSKGVFFFQRFGRNFRTAES